jgi:ABC-type enterochelin transport system substrate-binding protein
MGDIPILEPDPIPKKTHNYVVFDPGIIDIMKKYGIAGAAPAGLGALAAQDQYQP